MHFINKLIKFIKDEEFIFIQTHNFPDHDAVASAFGLQQLLNVFNIKSYLVYEGEIQRDSLKSMISQLNIDIRPNSDYEMITSDKIIIVDGCKGNKNVTDLIGDEIAVIDHHIVEDPEDVKFIYLKPEYGSCSTIIFSFYKHFKIDIKQEVADALLIGLNMDTSLLTREVSEEDIKAYSYLYTRSDVALVNTILRNYIQVKDKLFKVKNSNQLFAASADPAYSKSYRTHNFQELVKSLIDMFEIKADDVMALIEDSLKAYKEAEEKAAKLLNETMKKLDIKRLIIEDKDGFQIKGKSGKEYFIEEIIQLLYRQVG